MNGQQTSSVRVSDIVGVMERLAPLDLAEEWDNCGLHVGSLRWPVKNIWVALDPLPSVVRAAAQERVDLLITHHPLFLRPLRVIDVDTAVGKVVETALAARMAVYCAHTNLDSAEEGVNHILADALGLRALVPMVASEARACDKNTHGCPGMGRVGVLDGPVTLAQLARQVKTRLNLAFVKVAGDPRQVVHRVAVCSGGGSSLLEEFLHTEAEVYVSGDMRYHDARRVEDAGRALIDVGHFSSEHLVVAPLVEKLRRAAHNARWPVQVAACELERDPFAAF